MAADAAFFPYHEPSIVQILILTSFFVFCNSARLICDYLANVGILGELFVGLVYGAPLARILLEEWQATFTAVGYLGLIVIVFEGGLSTNLSLAKRNLGLSSLVAITGLVTPIVLSLILLHLAFGFTLLQAFTAGAALSTTSLGTTFSVISQAGFGTTRLGAVLTSAAVADDVVGLVLLQVVVSLGSATSDTSQGDQAAAIGWAVGRPLLASIAMLGISWALLKWVVGPVYSWMTKRLLHRLDTAEKGHAYNHLVGLVTISAYVAVAAFSGTSVLLGAFVSGLVLCSLSSTRRLLSPASPDFSATYEHHIHQAQTYILRPLFFASIGFGIPIKSLFDGKTLWQGVVYSAIMLVSKLVCGAFVLVDYCFWKWRRSKGRKLSANTAAIGMTGCSAAAGAKPADDATVGKTTFPPSQQNSTPRQPSLWPVATLLGSAMVARGEISLLIVNVAREASPQLMPDDLFYLTVWATLLCTIIGPVAVGLIVKSLERQGGMLPATWGPQVESQSATQLQAHATLETDNSDPGARATVQNRENGAAAGNNATRKNGDRKAKARKVAANPHVPVVQRI